MRATQSPRGIRMLYQFDSCARDFVKVVPEAYERATEVIEAAERAGLTHEQALERAYEAAQDPGDKKVTDTNASPREGGR